MNQILKLQNIKLNTLKFMVEKLLVLFNEKKTILRPLYHIKGLLGWQKFHNPLKIDIQVT